MNAPTLIQNNPTASKYYALLKREFLEHRTAFFLVPLVIATFLLGATMLSLIVSSAQFDSHIGIHADIEGVEFSNLDDFLDEKIAEVDRDRVRKGLTIMLFVSSAPILVIVPFMLLFTSLAALYEERRERSILFWKSMPVTDTQEVIVKLLGSALVGTLTICAIAMLTQLGLLILLTLFALIKGVPVVGLIWSSVTFVGPWLSVIATYFIWILWALPVLGWLLLVSAVARRAPLLIAIVPLLAIAMIEGISAKSSYFAHWIGEHLVPFQHLDLKSVTDSLGSTVVSQLLSLSAGSINFWTGILIGLGLLYAAAQLRRTRV